MLRSTYGLQCLVQGACCVLLASPVHQSFCMVLSLTWCVPQAVLYAALAAWSSGFASRWLWQEHFFSGSSWISLSALSNEPWCFLVDRPTASAECSCSMVFICFHCSSGSAAVTQWMSFLQHDLEIVFHHWVTKFVHLQLLRLGQVYVQGGDLKVKATLQRTSLWSV